MSSWERGILTEIVLPEERSISDSVEMLVHEHARMVFKIAYSVLRQHADAEDVTQDVFVRVMRHAKELDRVRNQKAWVAKIAWRTTLDRAKRRNRPQEDGEALLNQLQAEGIDIDERLAEEQRVQLLRAMIATLPRDLREPLVLSTVDEMSNADIADVLGIPEASVRTRMARARDMLRQKLQALSKGKSR